MATGTRRPATLFLTCAPGFSPVLVLVLGRRQTAWTFGCSHSPLTQLAGSGCCALRSRCLGRGAAPGFLVHANPLFRFERIPRPLSTLRPGCRLP